VSLDPSEVCVESIVRGPGLALRLRLTHLPTGESVGVAGFSQPHLHEQMLEELDALVFINTLY
jgi:hypothetical protein